MKRCPQCNSVFDDSLVYCTNDGTPLLEESFVLPSEASPIDAEEETVVRQEPITIDIHHHRNPTAAPTEQFNYNAPPAETIIPVVVEKPRNTGKYLLFLVLGSVLGGALVLAVVLFSMRLSQQNNQPTTTRNSANAEPAATPVRTPTATPLVASAKHEKRTDAPDDDFNGRVISQNAFVRSSPSRSANETDILPVGDRLEIEERAGDNSPWFRVTCEHGTTGWMHGNTIEYTNSDFGF
ncbi:MAG TPA: SH3 domain-containing protein [Pyrinomonadaceae bacterium]